MSTEGVRGARALLRSARAGTLATQTAGQPFAALVTPATAPDLSVVLLLSTLSEHTRHLMAEPRCALAVAGTAETANPQTAPRVTITGLAEKVDDEAARARWLALHPYAAMYAGFTDFGLWRIRPLAAMYVAGFARAERLRAAELLPDAQAVATVAAAEAGIIQHCNDDHADALAAIARRPGAWKMITCDVDGFDLAQEETVLRIPFSAPVADAGGVRTELVRMVQQARAA